MATYTVHYEVRKRGALGIFERATRTVEAADSAEARERVREMLQAEGWETRFPLGHTVAKS
jgi:hypothetical protein